jgi:hypothetical protein
MKKLNAIAIFTFLFLVYYCKSPTESYIDAKQYYPLEIGNKWYYSYDQTDVSTYNYVAEIIRDTTINNKFYYKMISYFIPLSGTYYISFWRTEKSKLYDGRLSYSNGISTFTEKLSADFSLNIGDTIRTNEYYYLTVTERDENTIKFAWYSELWGWTKYQRGVGMIENIASNFVIHRTVLVKSELK